MPLLSVVVPVFNSKDYLNECAQSILSQSFRDLELILVDDGSTDGSFDICLELANNDDRIKAYHKKNGGATSARKYGVNHALGEWILFVDSDDTMPDGAIEELLMHDDGKTDIIAGTILYKSRNKIIKTKSESTKVDKIEYIHLLLNRKSYYGPCSKLIKRTLFNNFMWNEDPRVFQNEDLLMLVQLAANSKYSITISNDYIHYISVDKEGSMSTRLMSYKGWALLFKDLKKLLLPLEVKDNSLFSDYVNYAIWSIYDCLLTQAIDIPQDEYMQELLCDAEITTIEPHNKTALRLCMNPSLRNIFCKYRKVKMTMRKLLLS